MWTPSANLFIEDALKAMWAVVPTSAEAATFHSLKLSHEVIKSDTGLPVPDLNKAGLPVNSPAHVPQWLSMFNPDFDAAGQHSFANLGCSGSIEALVSANAKYGMRGFLSIQQSGVWQAVPSGHHNQNETGLQDGWLQNLTAVLTAAEPHLRSGDLAGIFLGVSEAPVHSYRRTIWCALQLKIWMRAYRYRTSGAAVESRSRTSPPSPMPSNDSLTARLRMLSFTSTSAQRRSTNVLRLTHRSPVGGAPCRTLLT